MATFPLLALPPEIQLVIFESFDTYADILHLSATNRALHECFLNHRKTIIYCRARSDIANFDFAIDLATVQESYQPVHPLTPDSIVPRLIRNALMTELVEKHVTDEMLDLRDHGDELARACNHPRIEAVARIKCAMHGDAPDYEAMKSIARSRFERIWYRFLTIAYRAMNLAAERQLKRSAIHLLVRRQMKLQRWNLVQCCALLAIRACIETACSRPRPLNTSVEFLPVLRVRKGCLKEHLPLLRRLDLEALVADVAGEEDHGKLPPFLLSFTKGYWGFMHVCRDPIDGKTDCEARGDGREDWDFSVDFVEGEEWHTVLREEDEGAEDEEDEEDEETDDDEWEEETDEEDDWYFDGGNEQADNDDPHQEVDANLSSYLKILHSALDKAAASTSPTAVTDGVSAGHIEQSDKLSPN